VRSCALILLLSFTASVSAAAPRIPKTTVSLGAVQRVPYAQPNAKPEEKTDEIPPSRSVRSSSTTADAPGPPAKPKTSPTVTFAIRPAPKRAITMMATNLRHPY
jgi:hypothetical protein